MEIHAAARQKLRDILASKDANTGIVLLKGGEDQNQYDTDAELLFRY